MANNRAIGAKFEEEVVQHLQDKGYIILHKNYRCHMGEVDIIAKDDKYLVFIEVKYRRNSKHGLASEAVDYKKQRKISAVVSHYRMTHQLDESTAIRFDVATVSADEIKLIQNAFEYVF